MAYNSNEKVLNGKKTFLFKKFDLDLNESFTAEVAISKECLLVNCVVEKENLYAFFSHKKGFNIVKLDITTQKTTIYENNENRDIEYFKMLVNEGVVSIAGRDFVNSKKHQICCILSAPLCFIPMLFFTDIYVPIVINVDMNGNGLLMKEVQMKNYGKKEAIIRDFARQDTSSMLNLLISSAAGGDFPTLSIKTISGQKALPDINVKKFTKMVPGTSGLFLNRSKVVSGDFTLLDSRNPNGIFVSIVGDEDKKTFKTFEWSSFKFYGARQKKFKVRINKMDEGYFATDLINAQVNSVEERNGEYIVFAELYTPIYQQVRNDITANPDGYKNFGLLVFAVNENGDLLWENFTEINGSCESNEEKNYAFNSTENGGFIGVCNSGTDIFVINLSAKTSNVIETQVQERDKANLLVFGKSYEGAVTLLHDNVFIAFGSKKAEKDESKGISKTKKVFYLNKVVVPLN